MSEKQDKRRRRDIRKLYGDIFSAMSEEAARIIKPKPRFVPYFVWRFLIGFFIKVKDGPD